MIFERHRLFTRVKLVTANTPMLFLILCFFIIFIHVFVFCRISNVDFILCNGTFQITCCISQQQPFCGRFSSRIWINIIVTSRYCYSYLFNFHLDFKNAIQYPATGREYGWLACHMIQPEQSDWLMSANFITSILLSKYDLVKSSVLFCCFSHMYLAVTRVNHVLSIKPACSDSILPLHDDVIKRKHFPRYWHLVREIHRSPVDSPHKGQWRGALIFS